MPPRSSHTDRGMTLVELLVVVAIFLVLAVTVLPSISATAEARRSREAARMVTGFISKAQSQAIGRQEWAGFQLVAAGASSLAAIDLFLADVPPVYRGDTVPALLSISASTTGSTRLATGTNNQLILSGSLGARVRQNDLIRFDGRNPWYELAADATTGTSVSFRIRGILTGAAKTASNAEGGGQTEHNTPWPSVGLPISFEVLRQPVASGAPLSLADGRVIDLYWSGYGPPLANSYMPLRTGTTGVATAGATSSFLFDGTGRLRQIQVSLGSTLNRLTVTGPVFLLLGRVDRAGQAFNAGAGGPDDTVGANWQYSDSVWIVIDPFTGAVRSAGCKPNAAGANDTEKLLDSQQWIRQALLMGGN
jgi:prepilin-type N-terminal cleavage/methylation domain-containing protein